MYFSIYQPQQTVLINLEVITRIFFQHLFDSLLYIGEKSIEINRILVNNSRNLFLQRENLCCLLEIKLQPIEKQ